MVSQQPQKRKGGLITMPFTIYLSIYLLYNWVILRSMTQMLLFFFLRAILHELVILDTYI
jgi:hypothetical protein